MTTKQHTKQLTIRDVPDEVVKELRAEAQEHGQSLNSVVRFALLEYVEGRRRRQRLAEGLAEMDALRERIRREHGGDLEDSVPLLREDRER